MPAPVYAKRILDFSARVGEPGQPNEIVQTILITRVDGGFIGPDTEILAIENEGHIPQINDVYSAPTSGMTWETQARCRSVSYQIVNGSKALRYSVIFSTLWQVDVVAGTVSYVLPASTDYVTRTRSTNIYRTGWTTAPSNTNASGDIEGTAVSNGTKAKSENVAQIQMRLRLTVDASSDPMNNTATKAASYVDKLNSQTFANFATGSVLCEGVTAQKIGSGYEFYELIFEFVVDNWFHLEQVCDTDEKGYPLLNSSKAPSVVKWKRVARSSIDFNDIFKKGSPLVLDTAWQARALKGWWQ